jgi:DHA2 family multidrug resistance protein
MSPLNVPFQLYRQGLTGVLGQDFGGPQGGGMASGSIYNMLQLQTGMLAYQDVYKMLMWMAMGMVVFAFLLSKNKPGGGGGGAAMH